MSRKNGFGALRLMLALLVILSHAPEMADGNRHGEILTRLFGTLSFGDLAVDGFFIISGYLITASMLANRQGFLRRRIARIYPGFLVASLFCLLVVGPLRGVDLAVQPPREWGMALVRMGVLNGPQWGNAFTGSPYNALNGAMWTIRFEFRCYLLTYLLGFLVILRQPRLMLWLTGMLAMTHILAQIHPLPTAPKLLVALLGKPEDMVRLSLAYMVGSCFRLTSRGFNGRIALIAALLLIPAMFSHALAETALVLLGGYGLLYLALCVKNPLFLRINAKDDISYGVYLYAWPIGKLLFWYVPGMNVWLNATITACLALAAGWVSWKLVEQPAMRLGGKRSAPSEAKAPHQNSVLRTLP